MKQNVTKTLRKFERTPISPIYNMNLLVLDVITLTRILRDLQMIKYDVHLYFMKIRNQKASVSEMSQSPVVE